MFVGGFMNNLGKNIRTLRNNSSMTQEELALKLNTTQGNIYKYESSIIKNVPLNVIIKLSNIFSVSPQYLLGWTNSNIDIELLQLLEKLNEIEQAEIKGMVKQLLKEKGKNENLNIEKLG